MFLDETIESIIENYVRINSIQNDLSLGYSNRAARKKVQEKNQAINIRETPTKSCRKIFWRILE